MNYNSQSKEYQVQGEGMITPVILKAHFDGEQIRLDEPFELEPDMELVITVLPKDYSDDEREEWLDFSMQMLEQSYDDEEVEYSLDLIKEPNPDYEGG
jgi:hypothetical protein